jgi:hypothetical protein
MRAIPIILFAVAFSSIGVGVVADDSRLPVKTPKAPDAQLQLDPLLLHLLVSPDAVLIKALHEQNETDLLTNLGITTDQEGMATGPRQKKTFAFRGEYKLGDKHRHVFVYNPSLRRWPGTQPETIIICDASYRVLDWKEVGGIPMFELAALDLSEDTGPVLLITRQHRHTIPNPKRGVYRFSLNNDRITALPDVEWLYKDDAERTRYARWRGELREHERATRCTPVKPSRAPEPGSQPWPNVQSTFPAR